MNTKTTLILAAAAVLVAAYLFLVERPWEEPAVQEGPATTAQDLFDIKTDDVDRIEVTITGSQHPQRAFSKEDGVWMMTEPIACRANDQEVKAIVDKTSKLQYLKEHDAGAKDRPKDTVAGLAEPTAVVKLFTGDKQIAALTLGARLPTGKGYYVQTAGSDVIYETAEDLGDTFTKRLATYRNKSITKVDLSDVTEVAVEGLTNFKLVKSGPDWMIEEPSRGRAERSRADRVARKVGNLLVRDWIDDDPPGYRAFGLDEPRLKVTLTSTQQVPPKAKPGDPDTQPADTQPSAVTQTHVLAVGGLAGDKVYFARLESAPWVFSISDYDLKELSPDITELREKAVAKLEQSRVSKVEMHTPESQMTLTKQQGQWQADDASQCDAAAVNDLIKAVADLKASEFVDPGELVVAFDWDNPRAKVTLTEQGKPNPVTILVGPASSSGRMVYVRNAAEETIVAVREDEVAALLAGPASYRDREVLALPRAGADQIEITQPDVGPVTLTSEAHKWSLTEPVASAADADAVRNLLQDLSSLRAKRVAGSGDKAQFGLDTPAVSLAVRVQPAPAKPDTRPTGEPESESQPAETQPAAPPPPTVLHLQLAQRDGKTYVCRDDRDLIYEIDNKVFEDATAEMHDRQVAKFETDDILEVTFAGPEGHLTFRKTGDDWKYATDPVLPIDKEKVKEAINDFRDLKTHRYVAYAAADLAKYGLDKPAHRVTIAPQGADRIELLVSAKGPTGDTDKSRYAALAGAAKVFLLKGEQADKCIRKLDDFEAK